MIDLQHFQAKICITAAGFLVENEKVLLIKHKKLKIWLAPGGHTESNELPHQTAEREFFEETGITVEAVPLGILKDSKTSQYLPMPISSNVHWVSRENYESRLASKNPEDRYPTALWPKGCEQHFGLLYLMRAIGSTEFTQNQEETDGIAWFSDAELDEIETLEDIRAEARLALKTERSYAKK